MYGAKNIKKTISHPITCNHHHTRNILPINNSFVMLSFFSKIRNTVKPATYDHWLVSAVGFHSKQVTRGNILKRLSHFSTTNILDRSSFKGELSATSWPQYFVRYLSVCINSFSMILTTTFLPSGFNKIREWPPRTQETSTFINPLNPELNPICYLLALLGAHHFLHVSRIRVKLLTFRLLMSYIYGAPILDVSRSHTTTQHSR